MVRGMVIPEGMVSTCHSPVLRNWVVDKGFA